MLSDWLSFFSCLFVFLPVYLFAWLYFLSIHLPVSLSVSLFLLLRSFGQFVLVLYLDLYVQFVNYIGPMDSLSLLVFFVVKFLLKYPGCFECQILLFSRAGSGYSFLDSRIRIQVTSTTLQQPFFRLNLFWRNGGNDDRIMRILRQRTQDIEVSFSLI